MSQPPEPRRSQSTTSLSKYYNGPVGGVHAGEEEMNDPAMDFCNSFWGTGDRGYDVVMARLRGAGRTVEELRAFWKERVAIEEDYAKRLNKLSKFPLGRDEVGDLAASLQNLQSETAAQGSYHLQLSTELRQNVEQPTAEFGNRLGNLKKGLQASVEKAWRNRGLQEGHVGKARERYESDCLKLNSYTANSSLVQGKELEKLQAKLDRVRQTIGANEQDFKSFVRVLESTSQKWEGEWKSFCDHVQDTEEDRLAMTKDIIWAYANAVSQVCVEDDSSCERVREKLEQFEPGSDMLNFVKGWGTGDQIPDPPRFINYSAGESYPNRPTFHVANFRRISSKPPMPVSTRAIPEPEPELSAQPLVDSHQPNGNSVSNGNGYATNGNRDSNGLPESLIKLNLRDAPAQPAEEKPKAPFGGVALPGMASAPVSAPPAPAPAPVRETMPPPPVPPTMTMPEPRIPSRQSTREVNEDDDPMARALADLRRDPPPSGSIRRAPSHRRPESLYSNTGSVRGSTLSHVQSPPSPGPGSRMAGNRSSFQQPPPVQSNPSQTQRASVDLGLSPPAPGHTSAALAKSLADFERQSSTAPSKRHSTNYSNYADDVVGAHPSSPGPQSRGPSPAMMQPPVNPTSPIADEVLSQYHQAFPGERSRPASRANSISSRRSRGGSFTGPNPPASQQAPLQAPPSPGPARAGFVGIGAGGRSASPQPIFRSPSPSPVNPQGVLGPQSLGISLDERGGVAHDSMAEAYRRQYGQTQQQPPAQTSQVNQGQNGYGQQSQNPFSGGVSSPSGMPYNNGPNSLSSQTGRPVSGYQPPLQNTYQPPPQQAPPPAQQAYQPPQQQQYQGYQQQQQPHQPPYVPPINTSQQGYQNGYQIPPQSASQAYAPPPQQQQQYRASSPGPAMQRQSQDYGRQASPQPYHPQQQQQQQQQGRQQIQRSPSPQPGVPPSQAAPTGQWSTTGLPVLFYVKALYDYVAQSPAEFDFQAGDIIAVTSTPEDGWWSGELLDEARRSPGRTDFPSNFVCLF